MLTSEIATKDKIASLRNKAYGHIKTAIISNKLRPGTPLSEYWLAETLGMSRTPVREALSKLEQERFVMNIPGKGALVSTVTVELAREVMDYREAVEGLACRLSTIRMNGDSLSQLVRAFLSDDHPSDVDRLNQIGGMLHEAVCNSCGNSIVQNSLQMIRGHVTRHRLFAAEIPNRAEQSFVEHQAIVKALAKKDEEEAERAMRRHIASTQNSLFQALLQARVGRSMYPSEK